MRMLFDFKCNDCGTVTEAFVDKQDMHLLCPECHGSADRMISPVHGRVINPAAGGKIERWEADE
jgi:putative FmdB family regulatory protein